MKRKIMLLCMAFLLVLGTAQLSGCGNSAQQDSKTVTYAHCQGEWMWPTLEAITQKYEEVSGNKVELVYVAQDGYATWQTAQFVAETEPDIVSGALGVKDLFENGKILDLTSYYEETNPYTGRKWMDDYIPGILEDCKDISGTKYIANGTSRTAPQLFYNKDIFKELGLGEDAPKSWSEVLEICKKVQEDGRYMPFTAINSMRWSLDWPIYKCLEDLYLDSGLLEKLDIISPNEKLDSSEILLGLETGIIDYEDPRFVEYFRLMKEFSQYLNKGFNTASWEVESLFDEGKVAMTFNGGWYPGQHKEKGLTVNYGVGNLPFVDKDFSQYGREQDGKYIGKLAEPNIIVTQKCKDEGRADIAIDFLRFLAAADGGAQLLLDGSFLMPVVKDVKIPDILRELDENSGTDTIHYNLNTALSINDESADKYWKSFALFMENSQTPEEFAKATKELMLPYVKQEIEDRPELKIKEYLDKVSK